MAYSDFDLAFAGFRFIGVVAGILESVGGSDGFNAAAVIALQWLSRKPVGVSELSRLIGMHENGASVLVKRLSEGGLVRRRRSPSDRRVVSVSLTDRGKTLAASHAYQLALKSGHIFASLDLPQRKDLAFLLESVSMIRYDSGRDVYVCFKDDLQDTAAPVASGPSPTVDAVCESCQFLHACSVTDGHRGRRPYIERLAFESAPHPAPV